MDERHIRAVLEVARCGSITRAAGEAFASVQGLKGQVDAVERELGCALFRRSNRGVEPTAAGEAFLEEAPALLAHYERLCASVRQAASQKPVLRVSSWPGKEVPVIDAACARYVAAHPGVSIEFVPTSDQRMVDDIREGIADVGFLPHDEGLLGPSGLETAACGVRMGLCCLASADSPLGAEGVGTGVVSAAELAGVRLARTDTRLPHGFLGGVTFERTLPFSDRYAVMQWCMAGGACICDRYLAATLPGLVSHPLEGDPHVEFVVAFRGDAPAWVRDFAGAAREAQAGLLSEEGPRKAGEGGGYRRASGATGR